MAKAKGNRQSRRRGGGRKPKKAPADPSVQSKIYVNEAASHVKNGNYNRALNCYNSEPPHHHLGNATRARMKLLSFFALLVCLAAALDAWQHNVEMHLRNILLQVCPSGDVTTVFTSTSVAKSIISANRDTEYIQSFTRVDDEKSEDEKQSKKKSEGKRRRGRKDKKDDDKEEEKEGRPSSPKAQSKSTFAQISKELKARRLAQMAAAAKARKNRKNKRRQEEIYTDKDRAAAVNLGTRDIKQSLKLKKKQDRNYFQIPEEAEPGTLLALGNNELRSGDVKIALKFVDKALELNPGDKNSLVARSKCYLLLGEPSLALQDAETALQSDKTFIRAIHQKAEALYHLGDFEHSLMYYHRGHRLRPELEIFRLGVQKAQEAIENTIGCVPGLGGPQKSVPVPKVWQSSRSEKSSVIEKSNTKSNSSIRSGKSNYDRRRSKSAASASRRESKSLLGELGTDRIYLENLLKNPDIMCSNQEATNIIISQAEEGIAFLKSRQEFWRQQRPKTSHVPKNQSEISKKESQNERHAELA